MSQNLNILIVDDHTLFRKGLAMVVNTFQDVENVSEAKNGKECLKIMADQQFDIILLDYEMPVLDGMKTAAKILKRHSKSKIIMISSYNSTEIISQLIEIGIHSYLLKNADPSEVHQAIRSVIENNFYYNKLVSKALNSEQLEREKLSEIKIKTSLSNREIDVLQLICAEYTMKEIGNLLSLSEQTIQTHRKSLMKKTDSKNAVSLVKYAFQHQIASI